MPYVIDQTDGGIYQGQRHPAAEWLPQEQERNLREALGAELYDAIDQATQHDRDDYYDPKL